jgi:hypothetical protein
MPWDSELPGCFGGDTAKFALHPNDEKRALAWLISLRDRQIGWKEAEAQITQYLQSRGVIKSSLVEQIERARQHLEPWLRD